MKKDLLEAKNYLSQQGYGSHANYTTKRVAVLLANYAQEKVKKLQQHVVMQAEGSDGAKGAAVASSAVGSQTSALVEMCGSDCCPDDGKCENCQNPIRTGG